MGRGYIAIEGHGEVKAVHNLVVRLWRDLSLSPRQVWADPPIRPTGIHTRAGIAKVCQLIRARKDAEALLVLRDADDDCPKQSGPRTAAWVRDENLAVPVAVVLFRREYETLFLPCLARMAGKPLRDDRNVERPGLLPGTAFTGNDYEGPRDVKGWLSKHFPKGRAYKPTLDQLPLTRLIDFDDLRRANLPSFGTLERALRFLDTSRGRGAVYPPPP